MTAHGVLLINMGIKIASIKNLYWTVYRFSEGLALVAYVYNNGGYWYNYGYIDKTGREVIPTNYTPADDLDPHLGGSFNEGLANVCSDFGKCGYIDSTKKEVIPLKYEDVGKFHNGIALVVKDDHTLFITKTGEELSVKNRYNYYDEFSERLAKVTIKDDNGNKKYGFINTSGEEVVPPKYDDAYSFSDGMALVKLEINGYILIRWEQKKYC